MKMTAIKIETAKAHEAKLVELALRVWRMWLAWAVDG